MTLPEYLLEAYERMDATPEGRAVKRKQEWLRQSEMSDEEWWSENGAS